MSTKLFFLVSCFFSLGFSPNFSYADDVPLDVVVQNSFFNRIDLTTGVDITRNSFSNYAGVNWAPFGHLDKSPYHLKILGTLGHYSYESLNVSDALHTQFLFSGEFISLDVLLGYILFKDDFIAKVYFGLNYTDHKVSPIDLGNSVHGEVYGFKTQIDFWFPLTSESWGELNLSYSTGFHDYWAKFRFGQQIVSWLKVGPEVSLLGNENYSTIRLGGFAKFHTDIGEFTAASGVGNDHNYDQSAYFTFNFYQKF